MSTARPGVEEAQKLYAQMENQAPSSLLDRIAEEDARVASRYRPVLTVEDSIKRYKAIERFVRECMTEGIDYGKPPGFPAESKPFLYKPGAQKLSAFFGYVPRYDLMTEIEDWTGEDHATEPLYYYKFRCTLTKNEERVGEGIGSCNSWEAKYRYRLSAPKCPTCGMEAVIVGKAEYGGGFVCFKKKGGCGSKFADDDARIVDQPKGRVPNPEIPDVINTVQKQAEKRAYVEACLSATGASAFFSQDEDVVKPPPASETGRQDAPPAGTGAAGSSVASRPAATNPADPRLEAEIARAKTSPGEADAVMAEICQSIEELIGTPAKDRAWVKALKTHGDPLKKPSSIEPVIRSLWGALEAAKFSEKANPETVPA